MFGKKIKNIQPEHSEPKMDARIHGEGLGQLWAALTGGDPRVLVPQVVATVLHDGGTRPAWQWQHSGKEYIMMAWPQDQPIRAGVLMGGSVGGQLKPITAIPLMEGFANDLTVEDVHARQEGLGGDVAVMMQDGQNPMWFFNPFFDRDRSDLTPGVTHTFLISAAALGIRKALLDEITITQGPQYEAHAEQWLEANPGARRIDVPQLKINIAGKSCIMPGKIFGEYQIRATIDKVEDYMLDKMPIKALYLTFPFENRPDLKLPLYASQAALKDFVPEPGVEIESYIWLQGRIIDPELKQEP